MPGPLLGERLPLHLRLLQRMEHSKKYPGFLLNNFHNLLRFWQHYLQGHGQHLPGERECPAPRVAGGPRRGTPRLPGGAGVQGA